MQRKDSVVLGVGVAVVAACALYLAQPPAPIYYPLEHDWNWQKTSGVGMQWYGRSLWAVASGALAFWLTSRVLHRTGNGAKPAPTWVSRTVTSISLAVIVVALTSTVIHEYWNWTR